MSFTLLTRGTLAAVAIAALSVAPAFAQVSTYTDQAAFLDATRSGALLETFDTQPTGTHILAPLTFSGGGYSFVAKTSSTVNGFSALDAGGGDRYLSTKNGPNAMIFTFEGAEKAISAFGGNFFTTGDNGAANGGELRFIVNDDTANPILLSGTSPQSFFGVVSAAPLAKVRVERTATSGHWVTANNVTAGEALPEPETLALAATLLPLAAVAGRRRK